MRANAEKHGEQSQLDDKAFHRTSNDHMVAQCQAWPEDKSYEGELRKVSSSQSDRSNHVEYDKLNAVATNAWMIIAAMIPDAV